MDILLLVVLALLLVWMFFSSRRRQQKMREEQARKGELMVPGARVMTRSGLFGTLVEFDKDDLSEPAKVEIAPGVVVELHTQAIDLAPEETAVAAADADAADVDAADTRDTDATLIAEPEPLVDDTKPGTYTVNGVETDDLPGTGTTPDKRDDKNA
ncbi:preprotein translocase subunit YajC [Microbacterium sp. JZ31]|uniref:preprotein translocase subunit YajC n=1 Tax=Microbacterium sp. JZ31 TaxID=1906274 RepID=UPI001933B53D|nr:preprotein translocase subunit YajC [Microbacterium sp. JZ31]